MGMKLKGTDLLYGEVTLRTGMGMKLKGTDLLYDEVTLRRVMGEWE